MSRNPFRAAGDLFELPDYRRLWVAGALSGITRWLEFIALGIYAYELTHSPQLVALVSVVRMAPYAVLGFFIGALADRLDRRRLMIASSALLLIVTAGMTIATATGYATYPTLVAAAFVSGIFWTVDMPVRRRLMADTAGDGHLASALGFDNATTYATRALGPLIGGATYQLLGIAGIYALIALAYAICLEMGLGLTRPPRQVAGAKTSAGWLSALSFPLALVLNRRFAVIMGITLVHNLVSFPFLTMVPVISQKDFGLAPYLVGAMSSLEGFGGTVGAILIGIYASERTLFRFYFLGTTAMASLILLLSLRLEVPFAIPALLLMGAAAASFTATQYALVHVSSPPELRGRATGILSIFIGSAMLGHYISGQLFGTYTSPEAMRILGAGGLAAMGVLGLIWATASDVSGSRDKSLVGRAREGGKPSRMAEGHVLTALPPAPSPRTSRRS